MLTFDEDVEVTFRACSGARLRDLYDEVQQTAGGRTANRFGWQVDASTLGSDVGLLTLTIGGNDGEFSSIVEQCLFDKNCLHSGGFKTRDGNVFASISDWASAFMDSFPTELDTVFARLRSEAPNARIIVLGYPHLFPTSVPSSSIHCELARNRGPWGWSPDETKGLDHLGDELNELLNRAGNSNQIEVIDPSVWWFGHEPCGVLEQWTNLAPIDVHRFPPIRPRRIPPELPGAGDVRPIDRLLFAREPAAADTAR